MSSSDCTKESRCQGIEGLLEATLKQIALGRWSVLAVLEGENSPQFCYTAGLSLLGFPEVIMVGIPDDVSHPILNTIGRGFVAGDIEASHGVVIEEVATTPCELFRVSVGAMQKYMTLCAKVSKRENGGFEALQVVWPDKAGLFPWETGCDHFCHCVQGMLLEGSARKRAN